MPTWLRGRKFMLGAYCVVSGSLLAAFDKLTPEYVALASIVMTAFSTADTITTAKTVDLPPREEGIVYGSLD